MKVKFRFLVIAALLISQISIADKVENEGSKIKGGVIAGRVVDEGNLPLLGATVIIEALNLGAVSDVDGFYRLNRLEEGKYEVSVSYIGFKDSNATIQVKNGEIVWHDYSMQAGVDLNEVVINGSLQGQSKALSQQKNSVNITNVISSDQVGRFPDQNVGDALKRIPGINVQYDQGEARFGHVRGTAPEYNSVTIDGERIPSAEAEIRSIQLDLIPSDMIQSIEVSKVVTPDMDADAIGGAINLVTKSNPYKQRISGSVGTTYNMLSEKAAPNFSMMYGNRLFNNHMGVTISASIQDHKLGSDNIEAEWEDDGTMKEFQMRTYYVQRLRQSYSAAFDYVINPNHKFDLKMMYNHRNDWENRYRVVYKDLDEDVAKIERQLKGGLADNKSARLENQRTLHFSLGGEHVFGFIDMDWKASYSKASEERPHERYLQYVIKDVAFEQNLTDTRKPDVIVKTANATDFNTKWEFDELTEEYQYTDDIDKNFKVDFKLPILKGANSSGLKFGIKYKGKEKERENDFYEYDLVNEDQFNSDAFARIEDMSKDNYLAGDYAVGTFVNKDFIGAIDFTDASKFEGEQNLEELAGNFNATENVIGTYLRYDQTIGNLDLVAGLRYEYTAIDYQGKELIIDDEGDVSALNDTEPVSNNYGNIMPSIILKHNFSKDSKLKASWTNTLSRPRYIGLVPRVEINQEDNEIGIGNPDLIPTTSMNFDLMYEYYFNSVGIFSAGVFFKDINDFIAETVMDDYEYLNNTWDEFKQDINAGDANLLGFEVALQRQFDFMPGFLKQTGFYANYTFTQSNIIESNVDGRDAKDISLPGTPKHNINASLFYEGKKLSTRASFNFASDFVDEFGSEAFEDRYYDKVTYLDLNISYHLSDNFIAYIEANNLLNTPLSYYQGSSEYIMQDEYYNMRFNLGVKFNF
ncbi:MAG: TonB-dependent receptor [Prolixibacteraceae bacterium]|nr:TonB-dependent receptor [Prolixibacteraceae bacterium]